MTIPKNSKDNLFVHHESNLISLEFEPGYICGYNEPKEKKIRFGQQSTLNLLK